MGHAVINSNPRILLKGAECKYCRRDKHLWEAQKIGYNVNIEMRVRGNRRFSYLIGTCSQGHEIAIECGNFRRGKRCRACWQEPISARHIEYARTQGYEQVEIEMQFHHGDRAAWFVGKCPSGHPFSMSVNAFTRLKNRCSECKFNNYCAEPLAQAIAEGYTVMTDVVPGHTRKARLIGQCPEGHKFSMTVLSFKAGRRCRICAKHGYKVGEPGVLYILRGANSSIKKPVIKIGVFNHNSRRLEAHRRRNGFERYPIFAVTSKNGEAIALAERRILKNLREASILPLSVKGYNFSGSTETFLASDLLEGALSQLAESILDRVNKDYGSRKKIFQFVSGEEAWAISQKRSGREKRMENDHA